MPDQSPPTDDDPRVSTTDVLTRDEYIAVVAACRAVLAVSPPDDVSRPALISAIAKLTDAGS